ncbi:hypothetical protein Csa_011303 [Cucumis sativus]|uniref:Uncharacterized protein n=1 Tax=Cucumis sativus TaxID=3659 RepID=A0A0A0L5L4_CUCSA|nr:hypothetical protein Csa_011303 [Cucumis sativus]
MVTTSRVDYGKFARRVTRGGGERLTDNNHWRRVIWVLCGAVVADKPENLKDLERFNSKNVDEEGHPNVGRHR